jgi:hypothetical protein
MEAPSKFILPVALFLFTLVFGFWLSVLGKPYNTLIFNIHKLLALGTVVLAVIQTHNFLKVAGVQPVIFALVAVCVVCVIALFATGAFMSIGNLPYEPLLLVHRIALVTSLLVTVSMFYSQAGSKP